MPTHKQPRELAELKGATKHDPQRYRNEVPKSDLDLGQPPEQMSEAAQAVWFELEAFCLPATLTAAERMWFEITCNSIVEYRKAPGDYSSAKLGNLLTALGKLGLNPCDRQKIGVYSRKKEAETFFN